MPLTVIWSVKSADNKWACQRYPEHRNTQGNVTDDDFRIAENLQKHCRRENLDDELVRRFRISGSVMSTADAGADNEEGKDSKAK